VKVLEDQLCGLPTLHSLTTWGGTGVVTVVTVDVVVIVLEVGVGVVKTPVLVTKQVMNGASSW
jgi:hypothetical protein